MSACSTACAPHRECEFLYSATVAAGMRLSTSHTSKAAGALRACTPQRSLQSARQLGISTNAWVNAPAVALSNEHQSSMLVQGNQAHSQSGAEILCRMYASSGAAEEMRVALCATVGRWKRADTFTTGSCLSWQDVSQVQVETAAHAWAAKSAVRSCYEQQLQ